MNISRGKMDSAKEQYYSNCERLFHTFIKCSIVKTELLDALADKVVEGIMTNKKVLSDLANDHQQYQCVVLCRSVQCGATFAKMFEDDLNSLSNEKLISSVIASPEMYSREAINDVLGMSDETFYLDFCGALHYLWKSIGFADLEENDCLALGGKAAYQMGASMALSYLGY